MKTAFTDNFSFAFFSYTCCFCAVVSVSLSLSLSSEKAFVEVWQYPISSSHPGVSSGNGTGTEGSDRPLLQKFSVKYLDNHEAKPIRESHIVPLTTHELCRNEVPTVGAPRHTPWILVLTLADVARDSAAEAKCLHDKLPTLVQQQSHTCEGILLNPHSSDGLHALRLAQGLWRRDWDQPVLQLKLKDSRPFEAILKRDGFISRLRVPIHRSRLPMNRTDGFDESGGEKPPPAHGGAREYLDMGIFLAFFVLFCVICVVIIIKLRLRRRRRAAVSLSQLAKKAVKQMHTKKYRATRPQRPRTYSVSSDRKSDDSAPDACVICLEDYREGQEVRVLPCGHEFHKPCVDPWLLGACTCPLCMFNIVEPAGCGHSHPTPRPPLDPPPPYTPHNPEARQLTPTSEGLGDHGSGTDDTPLPPHAHSQGHHHHHHHQGSEAPSQGTQHHHEGAGDGDRYPWHPGPGYHVHQCGNVLFPCRDTHHWGSAHPPHQHSHSGAAHQAAPAPSSSQQQHIALDTLCLHYSGDEYSADSSHSSDLPGHPSSVFVPVSVHCSMSCDVTPPTSAALYTACTSSSHSPTSSTACGTVATPALHTGTSPRKRRRGPVVTSSSDRGSYATGGDSTSTDDSLTRPPKPSSRRTRKGHTYVRVPQNDDDDDEEEARRDEESDTPTASQDESQAEDPSSHERAVGGRRKSYSPQSSPSPPLSDTGSAHDTVVLAEVPRRLSLHSNGSGAPMGGEAVVLCDSGSQHLLPGDSV